MFIEVKMWTVKCDCCGKVFAGDDYSCWNEPDFSLDEAKEGYEWKEVGDDHLCPACWTWNEDNTEIIRKPKEQ